MVFACFAPDEKRPSCRISQRSSPNHHFLFLSHQAETFVQKTRLTLCVVFAYPRLLLDLHFASYGTYRGIATFLIGNLTFYYI